MKKLCFVCLISIGFIGLAGCSEVDNEVKKEVDQANHEVKKELEKDPDIQIASHDDIGTGYVELKTTEITPSDNTLRFVLHDFDSEKKTYVYVANKEVLAEKLENGKEYSVNIEDIKDAHRTDYEPKMQFVQYQKDTESEDIIMFKQVRYQVKK